MNFVLNFGVTPIRAVLFDRDDTITTTNFARYSEAAAWIGGRWHLDQELVRTTLLRHWQEESASWWQLRSLSDEKKFWQSYSDKLVQKLGVAAEYAPEILAQFPYQSYLQPVPNAREVMGALRAQGLKIGVLSNTLPSIDLTLEATDLADLVDVALATCLLGAHKPQPEAFLQAAQALALEPQAILFIDDRAENVVAARQIGMQAQQIDLTGKNPEAIHDLREVLELVRAG